MRGLPAAIARNAGPDVGMIEDSQADDAKKSAIDSAKPAPAQSSESLTLKVPDGMTRIKNPGQGNCLFESLSLAFSGEKTKPKPARSIRAAMVTHLRKHSERYKPWWDKLSPKEEPFSDWEEYLRLVGKDGRGLAALKLLLQQRAMMWPCLCSPHRSDMLKLTTSLVAKVWCAVVSREAL